MIKMYFLPRHPRLRRNRVTTLVTSDVDAVAATVETPRGDNGGLRSLDTKGLRKQLL